MNIEEFIKTQLGSVDELRAVLLFQSSPEVTRDADETAGKLYIPPASAAKVLESLVKKGILAVSDGPGRYIYRPGSKELEKLVEELARFDREKPVTLLKMVYSKPKDIEALADAFKIRKES
ncbi:MAG TPA: hypothetical protein VH280_03835 [Verrucomicrobiae bacterium]|nr:hypothetical protein [Verrucomicrobiae bacterium]